jgi:hypothetical protein
MVRRPFDLGRGTGLLSRGEVDEALSLLHVGVDDDSFPVASLLIMLPSGLSQRRIVLGGSSCVFLCILSLLVLPDVSCL